MLGEKLKQARLEKNISLEEIYKQTKIHPRVLTALEENRAEEQLGFVYIKSFLKIYAQYLGLDAAGLLEEYARSGAKKGSGAGAVVEQHRATVKEKKVPPVNSFSARDSRLPDKKPEAALNGKPAPAVNADKQPPAPVPVNRHPAGVKSAAISEGIKTIPLFNAVLAIVVTVALIFSFNLVFKNKGQQQKTIVQQQTPASQPAKKMQDLMLEVKAKDACWLQVEADKQVVFQNTLLKGADERWRAEERLELRIGKPEALEVVFNGQTVDLKKIQVKKALVVTREGITGK